METMAVLEPARTRTLGTHDRAFYSGMAILMALTVFIGFARSYYLSAFFGAATVSGRPITPLLHVHGLLFSAWVVLFVVQTALVATRRLAVHRRLGMASMALAAAMIVVGTSTAIDAAASGAAPVGVDPLAFLAIPLFDMVLFGGFVTGAMLMRRNKEAHKRLMLLAYVSIITAAVARIPGVLPYGPLAFFGLTLVFVLIGAAYDLQSRRRIHRVYLWGGGLLFISVPLRLAISGTAAWRSFAESLIN